MKYILIAILGAVTFLFSLGIPTDLIPNPWFIRMTPAHTLDYILLYAESILLGIYISLLILKKDKRISNKCVITGGTLGFLSFACPICNKILVFILGTSFLLSYLDPIRPYLGILAISLLLFSIFNIIKLIKFNK